MRKLIFTKFIPATDTQGSQIKATLGDPVEIIHTIPYPHQLSGEQKHILAAKTLATKLRNNKVRYVLDEDGIEMANGYAFIVTIEQRREAAYS